MQLEEFFDYKNQLMKELCSDPEIVQIVTGKEHPAVPNHDLPYRQIFPYEYVPETVREGDTFICFDVDIVRVPSKTFYYPVLYAWCFTHKSQQRLPEGGCRIDKLSAAIDRHLNGSRMFGLGGLELESVRRFMPITDYMGRVLAYRTRDFNRTTEQRPIPANRKERK